MAINDAWKSDCLFNVVTEGGIELLIDSKGQSAPCPTEILLSALGACSATDVAQYFKDKGFELKSLNNRLTHQLTDSKPRLYKSENLHFSIAALKVTEPQVKTAIENALNKYCHVCLMLQPKILITDTVEIIRQ